MSINKVITLISVVSFVVFGIIQANSADHININQFEGVWFGIGRILPTHDDSVIKCYWIHVTREEGRDQNFKQDIILKQDEVIKRYDGYGKIINSKIRVLYPYFQSGALYIVQKYHGGRELILIDQDLSPSYALISRIRSVPPNIKFIFDKIAHLNNVAAEYFSHDGCTYQNVSIPSRP